MSAPWQAKRKWRIARERFGKRTTELARLVAWKESLERRIATASELVNDGLPDPHFDCLEAEVIEFANACRRLIKPKIGARPIAKPDVGVQ